MSAGVQGSSSKIAKISDQACGSSITTNTAYSVSRSGAGTYWVVDLSGTAPGSFSIAQSTKQCARRTDSASATVTFTGPGTANFRKIPSAQFRG